MAHFVASSISWLDLLCFKILPPISRAIMCNNMIKFADLAGPFVYLVVPSLWRMDERRVPFFLGGGSEVDLQFNPSLR